MPQSPIVIWVARESDGVSFALDRETRTRLGPTGATAWPRVFTSCHRYAWHSVDLHGLRGLRPLRFVGWDTKSDYESIHGDITDQIVTLLTGQSTTTLKAVGGVLFKDRTTGRAKILTKPATMFSWPVRTEANQSPKSSSAS